MLPACFGFGYALPSIAAHGAGCYTAQAALKRLNRANERMAASTERAAVGAHWIGAAQYPRTVLEEAWDHCCLHSCRIPLPDGLKEITLPNDERIRIMGMAVVEDGGGDFPLATLEPPFTLRRRDVVRE